MSPKKDLTSLLAELREALEQPTPLDESTRDELQALAAEIESRLENDSEDETLVDRVEETLERFEGEHPQLVALLGRLADLLNSLGI
ncbi:MAG: DUF4404 family protein [Candidatus Dadabacteria bacterium]|nr:MAG: DUF4404 family protein [Candidatus Dadabacteria bacterium]